MTKNILIAYYTHSGNTKKVAEQIQKEVGGTMIEIEPETPYPRDYDTVVQQAKKEINDGYKPPLKTKADGMETYDTVFIGSPNWWNTNAPPIDTFLSSYDLSGKTVVPFCTHGGGGQGRTAKDVAALCPNSTVTEGLSVSGSRAGNAKADIDAWLKKIGMI